MSLLSKGLHKAEDFLGSLTGAKGQKEANALAQQSLNDAREEREEFHAAETLANEEKTAETKRLNKKQTRSARNSLRRPGFLDSSVEGTSDVLG